MSCPSLYSMGLYAASVPTLTTPAFWIFFGSLSKSGALLPWVSAPPPPEAESVWSPQPVSSRAPVTATATGAAMRRRVLRAAAGRRGKRAVITGSSNG